MMSAIWHDSIVEESNLAKQIWRLRKLFSTNGEQFIETLPKHGYRFKAELRRTVVEPEDAVIFEKSTLKRVTLAIENGIEPDRPALPPARRHRFTLARLATFLIVLLALGSLTWQYRRSIFPSKAAVIDPYAARPPDR